jgi:hypothetical protein
MLLIELTERRTAKTGLLVLNMAYVVSLAPLVTGGTVVTTLDDKHEVEESVEDIVAATKQARQEWLALKPAE